VAGAAKSQKPLRLKDPQTQPLGLNLTLPYPETEIQLEKLFLCLGITKTQQPLRLNDPRAISLELNLISVYGNLNYFTIIPFHWIFGESDKATSKVCQDFRRIAASLKLNPSFLIKPFHYLSMKSNFQNFRKLRTKTINLRKILSDFLGNIVY